MATCTATQKAATVSAPCACETQTEAAGQPEYLVRGRCEAVDVDGDALKDRGALQVCRCVAFLGVFELLPQLLVFQRHVSAKVSTMVHGLWASGALHLAFSQGLKGVTVSSVSHGFRTELSHVRAVDHCPGSCASSAAIGLWQAATVVTLCVASNTSAACWTVRWQHMHARLRHEHTHLHRSQCSHSIQSVDCASCRTEM